MAVTQSLKPQFDELKTNVGNITGEFNRLGNRVTALEAQLEAIDKYVLKEYRAKAEKILPWDVEYRDSSHQCSRFNF
jgi:hypothetical protein